MCHIASCLNSPQKARLGQILTGLRPTTFAFALWQSVSNYAYKNHSPYKYPSFIHARTGSIRRYFLWSIFMRRLLLAHPGLLDFCVDICCWLHHAQEPSAKHLKLQAFISNNLLGPLLGFTVSRCYVLSISPWKLLRVHAQFSYNCWVRPMRLAIALASQLTMRSNRSLRSPGRAKARPLA